MTLVVEQLSLGPIGTNCYLVRADRAATEAVVVDPGDQAAEIRLSLARSGASCAAILLTHSHYDHFGALADLAEGTGAPVWLPEGELDVFRRPSDFFPGSADPAVPGRGDAARRRRDGRGGGDLVPGPPGPGPLARPPLRTTRTAASSPATSSSRARSAAPISPSGTGRRCSSRSGRWWTRIPPETVVYSGHGPPTTLADELARNPFLAELRSVTKIERPRGTHDIIPSEQPLWQRVTGEMERLCALYGYRRIQTPVFEDTELFARTSGAGSDVVQKEMYTFTDRSDRSLTLRPEGTAPICRAYIEHGLHKEPQPQKLYTIGPMYRYGKPGRGRYREHWQLSVEGIGTADPAIDAEIIQLYDTLLHRLGVTEYRLELNSIGCRECRPAYLEQLRAWLTDHLDELDPEAREKLATSPLRVFDVKDPRTRQVLEAAPKIGESLCAACIEHFAAVRADLDATGVGYELVPTLVRGLDYYSRTTWEFIGPMDNENSTISGGGRYDYLVEEIGGPPTPGVGFGAGIERLLIAIEDEGGPAAEPPAVDVFVACEPDAPRGLVAPLLRDLRNLGLAADTDYAGRSLKGQLTQAGRSGALTTVILRPDDAVIRSQGERDEPVAHADVLGRITAMTRGVTHNVRRAPQGARRRAADPRGLGGAQARPRRARLRRPARPHRRSRQLVINPDHAPDAAELAHQIRNEFVLRAEGTLVARSAETVNPNMPTGRGRAAGRQARDRQPRRRRCRSSSTRRTSTRRSDSATAGSTCAATSSSATSGCARRWSGSSGAKWRRQAFSTSRRRSSSSRRRRAPATSSSPRGCRRAASTRCRRARRS